MRLLFNKLLFLFCTTAVYGQSTCTIQLKGLIRDQSTGQALPFASIYFEGNKSSTVSDEEGNFILYNLCSGEGHIRVTHIGCEPQRIFLNLKKDTLIQIEMHHHEELLNETLVHSEKLYSDIAKSSTIDRDIIQSLPSKSLAELSAQVPGVSVLRTGTTAEKPLIQGLMAHRLPIITNGLQLGGQQWGSDHAPEIDPSLSHHIGIVKGASSLAFAGNSLGAVVVVENKEPEDDPHVHGEVSTFVQSQGQMHGLNGILYQGGPKIKFTAGISARRNGDFHTPNYYLTNTSGELLASNLVLFYQSPKKWKTEIQGSFFSTSNGILRGSQVGNLTDFSLAVGRETPFFTSDTGSFQINAPSQNVRHWIGRVKLEKQFSTNLKASFHGGYQSNSRKEFDVRRGGRSEIPSLFIVEDRLQFNSNLQKSFSKDIFVSAGTNYQFINNTNKPETGILPLIPDYLSNRLGIFGILTKNIKNHVLEAGVREDVQLWNVATISRGLPREIIRYKPLFFNTNTSLGHRYSQQNFRISNQLGYSERAPEVHELYSFGLHQGVGSLEYGDPELRSEKALKWSTSIDYNVKNIFYFQFNSFLQQFQNYIFLSPLSEPTLTIRGVFPVFQYLQTNARIWGLDAQTILPFNKAIKLITSIAYTRGTDLSFENKSLIFMPPLEQKNTLKAEWKSTSLTLEHIFTAEQKFETGVIDLLPPPPAFHLFHLRIQQRVMLANGNAIHLNAATENLFNTSYRNYLNRLRYYAEEVGRNFSMSAIFEF